MNPLFNSFPFFNFFLFCSQSKKNIFYFNDLTIVLNYVVGWRSFFDRFVAIWHKNMALLVQNFSGEFFFVNIRFRLF